MLRPICSLGFYSLFFLGIWVLCSWWCVGASNLGLCAMLQKNLTFYSVNNSFCSVSFLVAEVYAAAQWGGALCPWNGYSLVYPVKSFYCSWFVQYHVMSYHLHFSINILVLELALIWMHFIPSSPCQCHYWAQTSLSYFVLT